MRTRARCANDAGGFWQPTRAVERTVPVHFSTLRTSVLSSHPSVTRRDLCNHAAIPFATHPGLAGSILHTFPPFLLALAPVSVQAVLLFSFPSLSLHTRAVSVLCSCRLRPVVTSNAHTTSTRFFVRKTNVENRNQTAKKGPSIVHRARANKRDKLEQNEQRILMQQQQKEGENERNASCAGQL